MSVSCAIFPCCFPREVLQYSISSVLAASFDIPPRSIASACLATGSLYPSALFPGLSSFIVYFGIRTREDWRRKQCTSTISLRQSQIAGSSPTFRAHSHYTQKAVSMDHLFLADFFLRFRDSSRRLYVHILVTRRVHPCASQ